MVEIGSCIQPNMKFGISSSHVRKSKLFTLVLLLITRGEKTKFLTLMDAISDLQCLLSSDLCKNLYVCSYITCSKLSESQLS